MSPAAQDARLMMPARDEYDARGGRFRRSICRGGRRRHHRRPALLAISFSLSSPIAAIAICRLFLSESRKAARR